MSIVTASREIAVPVSKVWATLSDFGGIHRYNASVESSPINEGTPSSGTGAERTCRLYDGNHIQERVVESVNEEKLTIEIFETSLPIKNSHGTFTLTSLPAGGTRIAVSMHYVVKYGPIGMLMDFVMMKRMLGGGMSGLLAGLDHHISTGETIEKGWTPGKLVRDAA